MIIHKTLFAAVYVICMLLTYFPRLTVAYEYMYTTNQQNNFNDVDALIMLASLYCIMVLSSVYLSIKNKHYWMFLFPFIAGVFDVIIVFVPLVPTILMLTGLFVGLIMGKKNCEQAT